MPVLPEYITLDEATRRYQVDRQTLTKFVESGIIRAVTVDGKLAVSVMDMATIALQSAPDEEWVTISEAARRLGIPHSFIANWVRYGWLKHKPYGARAKLVPMSQASVLAELKRQYGKRGSRLIKRGQEL